MLCGIGGRNRIVTQRTLSVISKMYTNLRGDLVIIAQFEFGVWSLEWQFMTDVRRTFLLSVSIQHIAGMPNLTELFCLLHLTALSARLVGIVLIQHFHRKSKTDTSGCYSRSKIDNK